MRRRVNQTALSLATVLRGIESNYQRSPGTATETDGNHVLHGVAVVTQKELAPINYSGSDCGARGCQPNGESLFVNQRQSFGTAFAIEHADRCLPLDVNDGRAKRRANGFISRAGYTAYHLTGLERAQ